MEARERDAAPADWIVEGDLIVCTAIPDVGEGPYVVATVNDPGDGEFIAHVRSYFPRVLTALREARKELASMKAAAGEINRLLVREPDEKFYGRR